MVLIDCGHGGMINGVYQDLSANKGDFKEYTFEPNGPTVYEGVINRQIAGRLIRRLKIAGIPFHDLNSHEQVDTPLVQRVNKINSLNLPDKWLLSIHSNKMTEDKSGASINARGCETFIAQNASKKSQQIQLIAEKHYKADGHRWRKSQTAGFYIIKHTNCPAILVENYFYTNLQDAQFLLSEQGQEKIAETLFKIVKEVGTIFVH